MVGSLQQKFRLPSSVTVQLGSKTVGDQIVI
jgi:hypothetical protein